MLNETIGLCEPHSRAEPTFEAVQREVTSAMVDYTRDPDSAKVRIMCRMGRWLGRRSAPADRDPA